MENGDVIFIFQILSKTYPYTSLRLSHSVPKKKFMRGRTGYAQIYSC